MKDKFKAGALAFGLAALGYAVLRRRTSEPPRRVISVSDLETYLNTAVTSGTPPGLSLAVVKDGAIVYSKGFGLADGPKGVPAAPETVYHWWSMTKIPTAVAILQLHEQGLLDIDDPVVDYLPYFQAQYPSKASKEITIRHLLSHSSGLPDTIKVMGWIHLEDEPPLNQTELLKRVLPDHSKLRFEPGTQARYTNIGYMVLGGIVEAVSGRTYEDYIRENFLQPLKMERTDFLYNDEMRSFAAVGSHPLVSWQSLFMPFFVENLGAYVREIQGGKIWFNRLYNDQTPPSGLIGPVTDVARFMLAYLNGGELDGGRILSPDTVAMMTYKGYIGAGKGLEELISKTVIRGLGWEVFPKGDFVCVTHGGNGPGFGVEMHLYPERSLGMVVMGNDTTYDAFGILELVASLEW